MADTFHVTADSIYFRGYEVATLRSVPASVRVAVEDALHAYHPDAIDPADVKELEKEGDDLLKQNYDLTQRVLELECELEDERDTVARLQVRVAALEEELEALEAERDAVEVRHDVEGWYLCTPEEAAHEDAGNPSVGFDGRAHYSTLEEAERIAARRAAGAL